jgi:hypothetical protein
MNKLISLKYEMNLIFVRFTHFRKKRLLDLMNTKNVNLLNLPSISYDSLNVEKHLAHL